MPTSRTVTARLSFRKGSTADWFANDPILQDSEPAWDSTLRALKIGDGTSSWTSMPYIAQGTPIPNIAIGDDPGAVNFASYAQKGNLFFDLSSNILYIATLSATLSSASQRENFIDDDVGKTIVGILDNPSRGVVNGQEYIITGLTGVSQAYINTTSGIGIIIMQHRGSQWEFANTPATVVPISGSATGPDGVMQTELDDFLTTESGDFLEFEE